MSPNSQTKRHKNKRHPVTRLKRRTRLIKLKLLRINDPPERIAKGVSLGVACGILPTFGFGGFIALGFAFIFRANKAAAILGSFIMNPVTTPFFWTLSIMLGSLLLGVEYTKILEEIKVDGFIAGFTDAYIIFLLGNVIITSVFSAFSYIAVKKGIIAHRRLKAERRDFKKQA